jgi:uncharacterized protein
MASPTRRARLLLTTALVSAVPAAGGERAADDAYRAEVDAWRRQREERLKAEDGWLSVVGLHWLEDGAHPLGRDRGNAIVLPAGPPRAGVLERRGSQVKVTLADGVGATVNGQPASGVVELRSDGADSPSVLAFASLRLTVIKRGERYGLRVKDADSPARRGFTGLRWFRVDEAYRVRARFVPAPSPRTIPIPNVLGQVEPMPSPGQAVFTLGGREHHLEPVLERGETQLFFIFRDETAADETYPAGRFLYADPPQDGTLVLDFNRAYSPPCAFTDFATCPLPPPQNRLPLRIEAGERRPAHH